MIQSKTILKSRASAALIAILFITILLAVGGSRASKAAQTELGRDSSSVNDSIANCRYGVAALSDHQIDWVDDFGAGESRSKFVTIHNGFDSADFAHIASDKYDKFTITYAGNFYFDAGASYKRAVGGDVMRTYSPYFAADDDPRTDPWRKGETDDFTFTISAPR